MKRKNGMGARRVLAGILSAMMIFSSTMPAFAQETGAVISTEEEQVVLESTVEETEAATEEATTEEATTEEATTEEATTEEATTEEAITEEATTEEMNAVGEEAASYNIEVNQGFSIHTSLKAEGDNPETYMKNFVAKKTTAVMVALKAANEEAAKEETKGWKIEMKAVNNGTEADNNELSASEDSFNFKNYYDKDSDQASGMMLVVNFPTGPDKGNYNLYIKNANNEVVAKETDYSFYETKTLNILAVPVTAKWEGRTTIKTPADGSGSEHDENATYECDSSRWSEVQNNLKTYLTDVYPVADINIEFGNTLDCSSCNMITGDGQKALWEEVNKLQTKDKNTGADKYDLILAFVNYRQDAGGGQGFTFGKPTNVITLMDADMFPTVAHEIAHCYSVGDEYDGGSFNNKVNNPPAGYGGQTFGDGAALTADNGYGADGKTPDPGAYWKNPAQYKGSLAEDNAKKAKIQEEGAGTVVYPSLHPYILSSKEFVKFKEDGDKVYPTISYMGSGYSGDTDYYWSSSVIWDHLLKEFMVKENKTQESNNEPSGGGEEGGSEESNVAVYMESQLGEASEDDFFDEDDFYDYCRMGDSRMIEVSGEVTYSAASSSATVTGVTVNPMFSYDGDLEYIEQDVAAEHNNKGIFVFAAVGEDGKIIKSPVDGALSTAEFYGGNYVAGMPTDKRYQTFGEFGFDAEYPEGTVKFVVFDKTAWDGKENVPATVLKTIDVPNSKPEGGIVYSDVVKTADSDITVQWIANHEVEVDDPEHAGEKMAVESAEGLYTMVYFAPQGDNGEVIFLKDGYTHDPHTAGDGKPDSAFAPANTENNWSEIKFKPSDYGITEVTDDAYVWIAVSDGVNGLDLYSDEDEMTLVNSVITVKGTKKNGVVTYPYTGSEITPAITVKITDKETGTVYSLKEGTDYTVSYSNNIKSGDATVKIKGIGEYSGTNSAEFSIAPANITKATFGKLPDVQFDATIDTSVSKKNKKTNMQVEVERAMLISVGAATLTTGVDYEPVYSARIDGKTIENKMLNEVVKSVSGNGIQVTVKVEGKGNYTGKSTTSAKFKVVPQPEAGTPNRNLRSLSANGELKIELNKTSFNYTGKAIKPTVKSVKYKDGDQWKTIPNTKYNVLYMNNIAPGNTASVVIIGKGGYTSQAKCFFTINKMQVVPKKLVISGVKNMNYLGRSVSVNGLDADNDPANDSLVALYTVSQPVVVKANGVKLTEGVDYKVYYSGELTTPTTTAIKRAKNQPTVTVKLLNTSTKVEWASTVKDEQKKVAKTFNIAKGKFNSNSMTTVVLDEMKMLGEWEDEDITYIFSKNTEKKWYKNYAYITEGTETIDGSRVFSRDIKAKVLMNGKQIDKKDYTIKVSTTKFNKVGKITITPTDKTKYSGTRVVKFKLFKAEEE